MFEQKLELWEKNEAGNYYKMAVIQHRCSVTTGNRVKRCID